MARCIHKTLRNGSDFQCPLKSEMLILTIKKLREVKQIAKRNSQKIRTNSGYPIGVLHRETSVPFRNELIMRQFFQRQKSTKCYDDVFPEFCCALPFWSLIDEDE